MSLTYTFFPCYNLRDKNSKEYHIAMNDFYSSQNFEKNYTYTGTDLGASWSPEKTVFRLWAPTAEKVSLRLFTGGTPGISDEIGLFPMARDIQGTWTVSLPGDHNGEYYTYLVTHDGTTKECCDPSGSITFILSPGVKLSDMDRCVACPGSVNFGWFAVHMI